MSTCPPLPDQCGVPSSPRRVGWLEKFFLGVAITLVSVFGLLLLALEVRFGAHRRHGEHLQRIAQWTTIARAFPPSGVNQHVWSQYLIGVHNSLFNVLESEKRVATEKIRELADHLERTQAAELNSLGGLLGLIDYLGAISPQAKDYGPFEMFRSENPGLKPIPLVIAPKTR